MNKGHVFIGLTDRQEEGTFVWGSGSQLKPEKWFHWGSSQPDNKYEGVNGAANCVSFYKLIKSKGATLWDVDCSSKRNTVCEKLAGKSMINFVDQRSSTGGQEYSTEVSLTIDNDLLSSK